MRLFEHISALGERRAGTAAGEQATAAIADYLGRALPEARVQRESFPVVTNTNTHARLRVAGAALDGYLYDNTGTGGGMVAGELLLAGRQLRGRQRGGARGKIVVFSGHLIPHRVVQISSAYEQGAAGVVLVSDQAGHVRHGMGYPYMFGACRMPAVGLSKAQWQRLQAQPGMRAEIAFSSTGTDSAGTNLLADLPGRNPRGGRIVLGAHYDSWHQGCQDNGIAVQLLADLMQRLAAERRIRHAVRGIFFDAEEVGIQGSAHHLNARPRADYKFFLNLEMPIPTRAGRFNSVWYSPQPFVRRSLWRLSPLRRGLIPVSLQLLYRFAPLFPADIDGFYRAGIPCVTTYCSNPYFHTPMDTADNLRLDRYPAMRDLLLQLIYEVDERLAAAH